MGRWKNYSDQTTSAAPLAVLRILFGFVMLASIVRFWAMGWIHKLYIQPKFFFSYYGFEWVKPLGGYTYLLFAVCGLSAFLVAIGYKYRLAILTFFLSFTYIELMDKTTYLNHYYFVSVLSFLMIFLPANACFSVDARKGAFSEIPRWSVDAVKLMLAIVYFYAGLAKLNSDWLLEAMPLKIWLATKTDLPLIGWMMDKTWAIYGFAWIGTLYDLSIPFLLFGRRTRLAAFALVVVFHVLTRVLFPIGMFPYIMIVSTLIFFDASFHERILNALRRWFGWSKSALQHHVWAFTHAWHKKFVLGVVMAFFIIQFALPWRYLFYPGELFWTEQGFRFSWRVMLMEKAGYAQFTVVDAVSGKKFAVDNSDFLTSFQEKQMSFQPDFILEYAHHLGKHFAAQGHRNLEVYVESYVALNGRLSTPFIDPNTNLLAQKPGLCHKTWILPFTDEIKGL